MPRKPREIKKTINVVVDGRVVHVVLHPPSGSRTSWYAYWPGLKSSRSTGVSDVGEAIQVVEDMLRNGGRKSAPGSDPLSDAEFEEIQRRHFAKKKSPEARLRAKKSLDACLEAISAFREITGVSPVSLATPKDCERFQNEALTKPKNWRSQYPKSRPVVGTLSPNTVIKWSVALQAAFERANRNAPAKKCVRGVVDDDRLLADNPWRKFSWIEGYKKAIRQFDAEELISLLDYFDIRWPGVTVASSVAKVCLWSWGRKSEVMGLRWDMVRVVGGEHHFEVVGKWGIDKWFRIPEPLYRELASTRTDSPYVFAAYNGQLRRFHEGGQRPWMALRVAERFQPENLGDWFYERVIDWSKSLPKGPAYLHIFRKTSLQYARSGEDLNRQVSSDARLGEGVMMTSYVKETDEEMRAKSNRTYLRIAASLPPAVAERYGYAEAGIDPLKERLEAAVACQNWMLASQIAAELGRRDGRAG